MGSVRRVGITGTGSYVPEKRLTNADLATMVDTSDEWITERTGIRERRIAPDSEACSDLAYRAAVHALEKADFDPADIQLIVVGTLTPDHVFPATACILQHRLGARATATLDVSAACSGFIYALSTGYQFLAAGTYDNALVIGAEVLSKVTDYQDRGSCILFGDGAGAVLLQADARQGEILSCVLGGDGSGADVMSLPAGGSRLPASHETVDGRLHYMTLRGREVYKFAVNKMAELVEESMRKHGIDRESLGLVVPHQVNRRIIESASKRLELPPEKVYINIDRYGNTSAASIPIALDEAVQEGRLESGQHAILVAFGAGLTWGTVTLRW
jgi:3-oxoacyl-[acyl-carrier-protein] synthase-3